MTSYSLPSSSQSIIAVTAWDWAPCLPLLQELSGRGGGSRALFTCPGHHILPAVPPLFHCKPAGLGKKWAPAENLLHMPAPSSPSHLGGGRNCLGCTGLIRVLTVTAQPSSRLLFPTPSF